MTIVGLNIEDPNFKKKIKGLANVQKNICIEIPAYDGRIITGENQSRD